jgi:hypothetical protein
MKNHKKAFRLLIALCGLAACYCSLGSLTGGSQVGNPATVVGHVQNTAQQPSPGVRVYLLSSQFVPAADTLLDTGDLIGIIAIGADTTQFMTVTDSTGRFEIRKVPWNVYNIFVSDTSSTGVAIRRNVVINRDTVDIGNESLKKPGCVIFNITDTMFVTGGYIAVLGTPLFQKVTTPGQYTIYVPDDTVSVVYSTGGKIAPVVQDSLQTVYVISGDTVDLTGIPPVVINGSLGYLLNGQPKPLSPADTVRSSDSAIVFIISGAYSNKNSTIEYQFYISGDSATSLVTPWGAVSFYRLKVQGSGWFYVSTRVRCRTPNGEMVSEWSPTCAILIP